MIPQVFYRNISVIQVSYFDVLTAVYKSSIRGFGRTYHPRHLDWTVVPLPQQVRVNILGLIVLSNRLSLTWLLTM